MGQAWLFIALACSCLIDPRQGCSSCFSGLLPPAVEPKPEVNERQEEEALLAPAPEVVDVACEVKEEVLEPGAKMAAALAAAAEEEVQKKPHQVTHLTEHASSEECVGTLGALAGLRVARGLGGVADALWHGATSRR